MFRQRPCHPGAYVKVLNSHFDILPHGLPDGTTVKIIRFETGARIVEHRGRLYRVPISCIDSGWDDVLPPTHSDPAPSHLQ